MHKASQLCFSITLTHCIASEACRRYAIVQKMHVPAADIASGLHVCHCGILLVEWSLCRSLRRRCSTAHLSCFDPELAAAVVLAALAKASLLRLFVTQRSDAAVQHARTSTKVRVRMG